MLKRLTLVLGSVLAVSAGSAGAGQDGTGTAATARAYNVVITVPGGTSGGTREVTAPPQTVAVGPGYSYGPNPSILSTGSVTASATADVSDTAGSSASSQTDGISIFGGEITVSDVTVKARAYASPGSASGDLSGSAVSGLTVLGQAVSATPNGQIALGDWGYAITLEQSAGSGGLGGANYRAFVKGLEIHLTADHGGLPANSQIDIGYAEASAQAPATKPVPKTPVAPGAPLKRARNGPSSKLKAPEPQTTGLPPLSTLPAAPGLHPTLMAGPYVFPVYGPSSWTDTYGAGRADVSYHHGDDIFAPLGAPLLACATGTVFSVGWNDIGGYRLWLRDGQGNQFYYAHLSAYSPLAVNGAHVRAGDVLGFVGNTGDAEGTPYHLHFEVHPVGRLALGYDGAVDPSGYLREWQHLQDISFRAAAGWAPNAGASNAPQPGAILLQVSDISAADGLEPGALERAMRAGSIEGEGGRLQPLPPSGSGSGPAAAALAAAGR